MDVNTGLQQLRDSGETWDAVQDELLLRVLQSLRDGILRRAKNVEKRLQNTSQHGDAVGLKLRAANCHLEVLAQSQFLEHRIQTEEGEVDQMPLTQDLWCSSDVEPIPEVEFEAIKKALMLGQSFVQTQEQEELPPLPPVIGSQVWHNSFITQVEDFLGETATTEAETPAKAEEEVQEADGAEGAEAPWLETMEAEDSGGPTVSRQAPLGEMNLAGQLSALLTSRGGPIEDAEDGDQAPIAKTLQGPLTQASPGKSGVSLFDDEPVPKPRPAKAPPQKVSPPGKSFFDDDPLPLPKAKAKKPLPVGKTAQASSLFGEEDPLFNDAKGKGKGKAKTGTMSGGNLFDDPVAGAKKTQASPGPAATLFDEEPRQAAASPAKSSGLFGDRPSSAPIPKTLPGPLMRAPEASAGKSALPLPDDEAPVAKTLPGPLTQASAGKSGLPLPEDDPVPKSTLEKASPEQGSKNMAASASLFDEKPVRLFNDKPGSSLLSLFGDGDPVPQPAPVESAPQQAPVSQTLPGPLTQVPKFTPEKAATEQVTKNLVFAVPLFDDKPVRLFDDAPAIPVAKTAQASSLLGFFGDEDSASAGKSGLPHDEPVPQPTPVEVTKNFGFAASLFDDKPVRFFDDATARKTIPLEKAAQASIAKTLQGPLTQASAKSGLSGLDEKPAPSQAPIPKALPGPLTQISAGKSGLPLPEEPVPKPAKAAQASKKMGIAASLFDDKPARLFSDKPAASLLGLFGDDDEDPLFNDAPGVAKAAAPKVADPLASPGKSDRSRTAPAGEGATTCHDVL